MPSDKKFDLDGFDVDTSNVCTADGGFVGQTFGTVTSYSADGAIAITDTLATLAQGGTQLGVTLADGSNGQVLYLKAVNDVSVNNAVVTVATLQDGTTITFDALSEYATLVYSTTVGWCIVSTNATVA